MIAIDTNVLVRLLIDDPGQPEQVAAARKLALEAQQVFVPQIVQVELVWVLQSAYKLDKAVLIQTMEHLLHNQAFCLQTEACFMEALTLFKHHAAGFSDCLIAIESLHNSDELLTFDKKLAKLSGVRAVK